MYGRETWCLILREDYKLNECVSEKVQIIIGLKRDEMVES
jgi:hypothetical protein